MPDSPERRSVRDWLADSGALLREWGPRRWLLALGTAVGVALVIGVPTDLINTPWFSRDIPPTWWSYPVWLLTAALSGLLVAAGTGACRPQRKGAVGGLLGLLAVGCPVCNKAVLLLLGTSGALAWFQPLQPILALGALVLLAVAVWQRLGSLGRRPTLLVADGEGPR